MTVRQAIKRAEAILPGVQGRPEDDRDPRWQRIIDLSVSSQSDPDPVWAFIDRWGHHDDPELRMIIGLVLLEHLLGYHFELIFPRVEQRARASPLFADTFRHCRKMGQAEAPEHSARWDALVAHLNLGPAA